MKFTPGKFYIVKWLDAAAKDDADDKKFGSVVETLGWIVKSNRHGIRIAYERDAAESLEEGEQVGYRGVTDIPRKIIMEAREVDLDA